MRNITSEMSAEITSQSVQPIFLFEALFDSGALRLWTGYGTITFNGEDYTGAGNFIGFTGIEETQALEAKGIVVTLSGVAQSLISIALNEGALIRNRPFRLYFGAVSSRRKIELEDSSGVVETEDGFNVLLESQLISTPLRVFSGLMDTIEINAGAETCDIRLSVESELIIGQRSKVSRYTDEEQKRLYPNDKGLEYINPLQDKELVW